MTTEPESLSRQNPNKCKECGGLLSSDERDLYDGVCFKCHVTPETKTAPDPTHNELPDDIFGPDVDIMQAMALKAEQIAFEDQEIKCLDTDLSLRKEKLAGLKAEMYEMLTQNNCSEGHKFDNGILIKPKVNTKIYKAAEVEDETMFGWLRANNLGSIIKEMVPWNTLSSTMKAEEEQGRDVPEKLFSKSTVHTTAFAGNGKKKFLDGAGQLSVTVRRV